MSKNLYRFFLLLFVCIHATHGQDQIPIIWGEDPESLKGYEINKIFGSGDNAVYVFRQNKRKKHPYALQKLSTDSLHTQAIQIFSVSKINDIEPSLFNPVFLNNNAFLLAATVQPKSDSVHFYAMAINPDVLTVSKPIALTSASKSALESEREIQFYTHTKKDKFMLIIPRETDLAKNEKYELLLFSDSLTPIASREIEIPYPAGAIEYNDALLDSAGNAYILASQQNANLSSLSKDRNIGRDYSLFIYNWQHGTLQEKSLSLGTKWLYDVKLLINKRNNIQIIGYYSNMIDLIMAGSFSLELDQHTGEVVHQGLSPFDRSFRTRFRPRGGNISDTELGMFNLNYVFSKDNGSAQLISEKNFTETTSLFNPGTGTYTVIKIYNYDEILITDMQPSSSMNYNLVIPKFQSSTQIFDTYTSFTSFAQDNKTFVFYNDHERNKNLNLQSDKGYRQLTSLANIYTAMVVIHEKGEMVKIPLYDASRERPVFNPNFIYPTSDGVILVAGIGYDIRFFKVKLK